MLSCAAGARSLLDVGAGDGFLARAAREAGVPRVVAIEKGARRSVVHGAGDAGVAIAGVELVAGDLFCVEVGRFDVVVANLPDDVLFAALPRLGAWMSTGGALVVTGARLHRARSLGRELRRIGLTTRAPAALDGWCCFTAFRPGVNFGVGPGGGAAG